MPIGVRALASIVILSGLVVATRASDAVIDYTLDDGAGNFTIGPSEFDANMTWLNTFEAEPGFESIFEVAVSFGDLSDNTGNTGPDSVTVAVLEDPNDDGDPSDAVLLSTGVGVWTDQASNVFLSITLDAPARVEGTFFVAVMMDVIQRANPARMDPQGQGAGSLSWLFYNPEPNLDDLGSSPFVLRMSDSPFLGAWMIRASGTCLSVCAADLVEPFGVLNFFDVAAFLASYNTREPAADLAQPLGVWNFFDIVEFLRLFDAGCAG
ncbi:MAG: GC-type dockerin domain-anchored protein [Planctomycetota bacterium]